MTDSLHHYFAKLLTLLPAPAPAHRPYTALDSVSVGARPLVALAFGVTRLGKLRPRVRNLSVWQIIPSYQIDVFFGKLILSPWLPCLVLK